MTHSFETMTDAELVKTLHDFDPLSPNLSDPLVEMWRRGLREAERYGRRLMAGNLDGNLNRHPDTRLYDVLEVMCGCFNRPIGAEAWLHMAPGYEQRILDTLMIITLRTNPEFGYEVLQVAERERDDELVSKALLSVVRSVPANEAKLQACLVRWAREPVVMPVARLAVFRRLGELPRTPTLEDFFVQNCVDDDGSDPALTEVINDALRRPH
jgi:hypothetical protein